MMSAGLGGSGAGAASPPHPVGTQSSRMIPSERIMSVVAPLGGGG
jgi:hypothetical protein